MNLKHFLTHLEASALKVTNPAMSNKVHLRERWWMMVEAVTEELFGYEMGCYMQFDPQKQTSQNFFKIPWVRHFGSFRRIIQEEANIVASSALAFLAIAFQCFQPTCKQEETSAAMA